MFGGTLQFNFPWAKSAQLFWKTFTDVCWIMQGNRHVTFFFHSIFVLLLKLRTVNPFSSQPTPACIQSWISAFIIRHLVLQLAHSNCYHTTDGKFHLGFLLLTNGCFVDVFFSLLQSISLCGLWMLRTQSRVCRENRMCQN